MSIVALVAILGLNRVPGEVQAAGRSMQRSPSHWKLPAPSAAVPPAT